jgi:hypothetical protein
LAVALTLNTLPSLQWNPYPRVVFQNGEESNAKETEKPEIRNFIVNVHRMWGIIGATGATKHLKAFSSKVHR